MSPAELYLSRYQEGAIAPSTEIAHCCKLISLPRLLPKHKRGLLHIAFLTRTPFAILRREVNATLTARSADQFLKATRKTT